MTHRYSDLLFSNSVKAAQELYGSRAQNTRFQSRLGPNDQLSQREVDFIARRDSFYLATVGETDWPYVQHRGGPPGFLRCLDGRRLAFPDFRGNGQLISTGNLSCNDRCSIILVDYPNRRRLKILGRMHMQDVRSAPTDIVGQLDLPGYRAIVERVALVDVSAYDWNCPQHITKRYTESEIETLLNEKITN